MEQEFTLVKMKMNKRGQTIGLAIIVAIFIFIIGMVCINFLKDEVTTARDSLDCSSVDDISEGIMLTCLVVDVVVFYWIIIILSVVGGLITSRMKL